MSPRQAIEAIRAIADANGASPDLPADKIEPILDRVDPERTWVGEAKAAYDQSVVEAGMLREQQAPDFWVARAQAAAAIEAAEQARAANLIAWRALQSQRASHGVDGTPSAPDALTDEIEQLIGITS